MAQVNVKNFVDIDIIRHITSQNVGTRDTVVLFSSEEKSGTLIPSTEKTAPIKSLAEAKVVCGYEDSTIDYPTTYRYLEAYFNNGGVKAIIIGIDKTPASGTFKDSLAAAIDELEDEYICICYASPNSTINSDYDILQQIAADRNARLDSNGNKAVYGVNQKLIIARYGDISTIPDSKTKNFIVKYANNSSALAVSYPGVEMTIAAYLSKINVYKDDTVYDYMFTVENLKYYNGVEWVNSAEQITDAQYKTLMERNVNVDIMLANQLRNCGGNCSDGDDITDCFARIVLQQTLTNTVLNTLTQKLKNQSGLNKIYSAMSNELEKYKTCGYLTTDKIWEDEDLYLNYNGQNYLIIEKGTAIQNGYYIKILPFNSLSEADRASKKTPPIYLIIAEQYGIRKITINGEAI